MRLEYFRMVDRVARLDTAARSIVCDSRVPDASPVFEGHFPGHPILPGVLMIETMAQTGGWLLMALTRFERMAFLGAVKEAKFRGFVSPGTVLATESRLVHDGSGYAMTEARITAGGRIVAEAAITYRTLPFANAMLRAAMLATAREVGLPEETLAAETHA
jgi:3-hydroxyacyl-[acyl-carrier-protein] dehydratase